VDFTESAHQPFIIAFKASRDFKPIVTSCLAISITNFEQAQHADSFIYPGRRCGLALLALVSRTAVESPKVGSSRYDLAKMNTHNTPLIASGVTIGLTTEDWGWRCVLNDLPAQGSVNMAVWKGDEEGLRMILGMTGRKGAGRRS
jgi:hypothetical protein